MRYVFLIYGDEAPRATWTPEQFGAELQAYNSFTQEAVGRGVMRHAEALHPVNTATTVRVREGKALTTDGPFAETKEQLGGFYILDCKDLDEAIEMAAKIPGALEGSIEIRPLVEFNQ